MHCVSAITKALQAPAGVTKVEVSLEDKTASIDHDENIITVEQLIEIIEDQGYDVVRE